MVSVAPSILAADFDNLEREIKSVEAAGADYIHIDVMDGEFVNNKTPGIDMLERANEVTNLPLDTHLMVENPEDWIDDFIESDTITFHIEATDEERANAIIEKLHEHEIRAGIAIKPNTSIEEVLPYIDEAKKAGANIIVAGTAIFKAENRKYVIEKMKH